MTAPTWRVWRHVTTAANLTAVLTLVTPAAAAAQPFPRGVIVDEVRCADDPTETYALYLPSDYSADRVWNLLLAFHPSARGRVMVETYRAAAERYGYVVAASTTSRNGSWDVSAKAVRAMSRDVGRRFAIDAGRLYLTGHSGGARVAMEVALGSNQIAGVIASSAGFPDAKPRGSVRFPVFATAGADDFNYLELRRLDGRLASPHHLAVFAGGHELPPSDVATQAIEWLELAAMREGRRAADNALVDTLYAAARRRADDVADPAARLRLWRGLVADFAGLRDVTTDRQRVATMEGDPAVKQALASDRAALDAEARALDEAVAMEGRLRHAETRTTALERLDALLGGWARAAAAPEPTAEAHRARRLLGAIAAGAAARVDDEEYTRLVRRHRGQP